MLVAITAWVLLPIALIFFYTEVIKPAQDAKKKKRNQSKNDAILSECPTWTAHNISKLLN